MLKGYWIAHVTVNNPDRYDEYVDAVKAAFKGYDVNYLVRGGSAEAAEGATWGRHVVMEFGSLEEAQRCYHSPEYQRAAAIRQQIADAEIILVEGV